MGRESESELGWVGSSESGAGDDRGARHRSGPNEPDGKAVYMKRKKKRREEGACKIETDSAGDRIDRLIGRSIPR